MDGAVATITLSRPGKRNSMSQKMFAELAVTVGQVAGENDVRVLIIRGDKGTFCAGDDLSELGAMEPSEVRSFLAGVQDTCTRIESLEIPVLAAVEGFALGGGLELALSCDLILVSEDAQLGLPEVNLGIIPGLGGTIRLPKRTGLGRAREMIYSGRIATAKEALGMGLADAVFSNDRFKEEVHKVAALLASKSPTALALAKSTLNRGMDASLEAGLALEREAFAYCFSLPDAKEGISAFLEKRKPKFS
jgi:enoyl-CoA hydratase